MLIKAIVKRILGCQRTFSSPRALGFVTPYTIAHFYIGRLKLEKI